ncbi:MAG: DNA polymerase III subunit alpha [Verrucomicrobiales bacterium]|nr:DNA polymerase III subunit alpha [Verrucomicrobiales bacterium]
MPADPFIHLHLHTEYSLLDGAVRIKDLMKKAERCKMPAVAMTDHGNIFGAIDFYQACTGAGIKPIIGCEAYLTPPGVKLTDKKAEPVAVGAKKKKRNSHITLLAANNTGYANLMKLTSIGHLEGMYYKPRIDKETLAAHSEGIICLSGCINGEVNQFIQNEDLDNARKSIGEFRDIFGPENFFLEVHDHGFTEQALCTKQMVEFGKEFDLGLVAANDVHFLNAADHDAHDVMICIGTGSLLMDENRMKYSPEVYFKTSNEMRKLFKDLPEAVANTYHISQMIDVEIHLDSTSSEKYPQFDSPDGSPREAYFRKVCFEGLEWRYGERANTDEELRKRLDYEIGVMEKMGFVSYFLITWDFVKWAKDNGVPVGPGRGSAAGSIVAYVLGITDICPLRFGLIFERFLNPERVSPPDIDIDFCQTRRPQVIEYVRRKYGERAVSHIVTFGTLGAKSVVRDVSRVMGLSFSEGDRMAKMIPNELNITLADAKKKNPDLKAELENNPTAAELWKTSMFLEGLTRGTGIHAAGVVIGDRELTDHIPLIRGKEGEVVTQYAMSPLTDVGMLKMDFLGLKTLTVIQDAMDLIHVHTPDFELDNEGYDDKATFDLLNRGETTAVFQLESGGMMNLCRQFDVNRIEDIIALIALYRPGPMDLIPDFIDRKKGKKKVKYLHPLLEEASEETYGILIYQEQVQRAANLLGGYSLGEADLLRRAMGKKKVSEMIKQREKFVKGCREVNNIPEKQANEIFDLLEKFAGYGFNKSHSAAYGLISYHTAFLKANYPVEFMAGVLSNEINNMDKISVFVAECQRMGIEILAPNVNRSRLKFAPETLPDGGKAIRFGLAAIKNVGGAAMEVAIKEREENGEFKSLEDFASRLDSKSVNRKILENLIKAGAFDFTMERRDDMFSRVGQVIAGSSAAQKDRATGQTSLFDMNELMAAAPVPDTIEEDRVVWNQREYLTHEKDLLGFYVTGHPLDEYRPILEKGGYNEIGNLAQMKPGKKGQRYAGLIAEATVKYTKREGKPFAILLLEDFTGTTEVMVWNETFQKCNQSLVKGNVIELKAKIEQDNRSDENRLTADEVKEIQPDPNAVQMSVDPVRHAMGARATIPVGADPTGRRPTGSDGLPNPVGQHPVGQPNGGSSSAGSNGHHSTPPFAMPVLLRLDSVRDTVSAISMIRDAAQQFPGDRPLHLEVRTATGKRVTLEAGTAYGVSDEFATAEGVASWIA